MIGLAMLATASAGWMPTHDAAGRASNRGLLFLEYNPKRAERAFKTALLSDPECGLCHAMLAAALIEQDRIDEGCAVADEHLGDFAWQGATAWVEVRCALAEDDPDAALAAGVAGVAGQRDSWVAANALVTAAVAAGDTSKVQSYLNYWKRSFPEGAIDCLVAETATASGDTARASASREACVPVPWNPRAEPWMAQDVWWWDPSQYRTLYEFERDGTEKTFGRPYANR